MTTVTITTDDLAALAAANGAPSARYPRRDEIAMQALDLLASAHRPLSRYAVGKPLGLSHRDGTLRRAVDALVDAGLATRTPDGRYVAAIDPKETT